MPMEVACRAMAQRFRQILALPHQKPSAYSRAMNTTVKKEIPAAFKEGTDLTLRHVTSADELKACWPVMHQLRTQLADVDEFVQRVNRMRPNGYRILAAWQKNSVVALAGYHVLDNFIYGKFLYVDDLVTAKTGRSGKLGSTVLKEIFQIASKESCASVVLDTALSNALAQRFYFRQGMLTQAIRFVHNFS